MLNQPSTTTLANAMMLTSIAVKAKPLSNPLTVAVMATGRFAATTPVAPDGAAAAVAGRDGGGGEATRVPVAPGGGGNGAFGAAPGGGGGAPGGRGGAAAPDAAEAGPPAGKVGNLIVGAAVGFGGKLIRTVSFFG